MQRAASALRSAGRSLVRCARGVQRTSSAASRSALASASVRMAASCPVRLARWSGRSPLSKIAASRPARASAKSSARERDCARGERERARDSQTAQRGRHRRRIASIGITARCNESPQRFHISVSGGLHHLRGRARGRRSLRVDAGRCHGRATMASAALRSTLPAAPAGGREIERGSGRAQRTTESMRRVGREVRCGARCRIVDRAGPQKEGWLAACAWSSRLSLHARRRHGSVLQRGPAARRGYRRRSPRGHDRVRTQARGCRGWLSGAGPGRSGRRAGGARCSRARASGPSAACCTVARCRANRDACCPNDASHRCRR